MTARKTTENRGQLGLFNIFENFLRVLHIVEDWAENAKDALLINVHYTGPRLNLYRPAHSLLRLRRYAHAQCDQQGTDEHAEVE